MGHGNRTSGTDLLAEAWHHGARTIENTAEANGGKDGPGLPFRLGLQHKFRKALRRPHHIGWAHGLVSRDQNKALDATTNRGLSDRHMLVGGSMIDGFDSMLDQKTINEFIITNRSQNGNHPRLDGILRQTAQKLRYL